jgi:hypothetical protein
MWTDKLEKTAADYLYEAAVAHSERQDFYDCKIRY